MFKKTDVRQCEVLKKLLGNGLEGDWKLEMTGWQGRLCLDRGLHGEALGHR